MREIDIRKSIKKRKLVTKRSLFFFLFPYLVLAGMLGFMLYVSISDMISNHVFDFAASQVILLIFILFLVPLFIIKNGFNAFAFQVVHGKSKDENIKIAERVLQENKKLKVKRKNKDFIRAYFERSLTFDWGNELYIIFDNEDVLINFCSFARFDMPQPFRFYSDREFERKLINKFIYILETPGISVVPKPKFWLIKAIGLLTWASIIVALIWLFVK